MPPPRADASFDEDTLLSSDAEATRANHLRKRTALRWSEREATREHWLNGRAVLGSAPGSDIVVRDPTVSRLHLELHARDDGVWLRDLGSRNGTSVDGMRVVECRLPATCTLRVGASSIRVETSATEALVDVWPQPAFGPLVGRSVMMRELFAQLATVAQSDATTLVMGETGTGKELIARAIHDASPRAGGPFVVVDCGSLTESLLEAELFGHTRGAFTGAVTAREGAIESADGGTVFLDEIGELPLGMQPRLLRVLESRTVRRVGETQHRSVDVRFISATHRDLRTMVNAGAFREDLYFRIAVIPLTVPPLRAHLDDLPDLIAHFAPATVRRDFGGDVMRELMQRQWLGNVREVRNFVERAAVLGVRNALRIESGQPPATTRSATPPPIPGGARSVPPPPPPMPALALPSVLPEYGASVGSNVVGGLGPISVDEPFKVVRDRVLDDVERRYLAAMLERHGGNVTAAALAAGLARGYVHRLMKKHGL